MNRIPLILVSLVALSVLIWRFPLFHIVPLDRAAAEKVQGNFNAEQFVEKFWSDRLLKSFDKAVNAEILLPLIQSDPAAAKKQYSRSLGLSDAYTYYIQGSGRIVNVTGKEISLIVTAGAARPQIVLQTGLLFGNAARDATGLLDVNDYPNSQDFNAISQELNRMIETKVLPALRERAKVGATVRFVGCAEITDPASDLNPLRIVPIQAEVQ